MEHEYGFRLSRARSSVEVLKVVTTKISSKLQRPFGLSVSQQSDKSDVVLLNVLTADAQQLGVCIQLTSTYSIALKGLQVVYIHDVTNIIGFKRNIQGYR